MNNDKGHIMDMEHLFNFKTITCNTSSSLSLALNCLAYTYVKARVRQCGLTQP